MLLHSHESLFRLNLKWVSYVLKAEFLDIDKLFESQVRMFLITSDDLFTKELGEHNVVSLPIRLWIYTLGAGRV